MPILRRTAHLAAPLLACAAWALSGCGAADDDAAGTPGTNAAPLPGDPAYRRDPALDVDNISAHGEKRSHNMGLNCMGCHQPHGPGRGLFTAAGTAYTKEDVPAPGATVELRTESEGKGDLVLAIDVDDNGNFFTTRALPMPEQELFPFLRAADGSATNFMPFSTISGACNLCHNEQKRVHVE